MPVSDSMVVGGSILPSTEFDESAGIYEDFSRGLSVIGTSRTPMTRDGVFKNGQYSHGVGLPWAHSTYGSHYQANGERQYIPSPYHSACVNPLSQYEMRNGNLVMHARRTSPTEQDQYTHFKGYYINPVTGKHAEKSFFTAANGFPSGPPQAWAPVSEDTVWRFEKMPAQFISPQFSLMGRYAQSHGRVMTRGTVASGAGYLTGDINSGRNYQTLEAFFAAVVWALEDIEFGKNMNGQPMLNSDGSVRMWNGAVETDLSGNILDGGSSPEFDGMENFSRSTNYSFANMHYHDIDSSGSDLTSTPGMESPTADCRNNLYTYGYDYTPEKVGFFINDKYFAVKLTPTVLANPKPYFVTDPDKPYAALLDVNGKALTDGIRKHADGSDFWSRFSWISNLAVSGKVAIDQSYLGLLNNPSAVGEFTGVAEQHIEYMAMFPLLETPDQNPVVKYTTEVQGGAAPVIPAFFTRPDQGGAIVPARGNYTLSTATYLGDVTGDDVYVPPPPLAEGTGPFKLRYEAPYLVWDSEGSVQFDMKRGAGADNDYITTIFGPPYQWEPPSEGSYSITAVVDGVGVNSNVVTVVVDPSPTFDLQYDGTDLTWDDLGAGKFTVKRGTYEAQTSVVVITTAPYTYEPTVNGDYFVTATVNGNLVNSAIVKVEIGTGASAAVPFELGFDGQFLVWDPRTTDLFTVRIGTVENSTAAALISSVPYRFEPTQSGNYFVRGEINGVLVPSNTVSVDLSGGVDLDAFTLRFSSATGALVWDTEGYNEFRVATGDPNGAYEVVVLRIGVAPRFEPTYSGDYFVYVIKEDGTRLSSAVVSVNLGDSNLYDFSNFIGLAPGSTMRVLFSGDGVETVVGLNVDAEEQAQYTVDLDYYYTQLYEKWRVDALYTGALPSFPELPDNPTSRETNDYNASLYAYSVAVYNSQVFHAELLRDLTLDDKVPFDTFYFESLWNFAMHYCYSIDDDVTANSGRSQKHWQQALQLANVQENGSGDLERAQIEDDR